MEKVGGCPAICDVFGRNVLSDPVSHSDVEWRWVWCQNDGVDVN